MSDTMDEVLYAVGRGVKQLRGDIASVAEKGRISEMEARSLDRQVTAQNETITRLRSDAAAAERQHRVLADEFAQARGAAEMDRARATRTLAEYDAVTLALSLLIPELEAHRDNASTKAAGIAYGHVVERLLEIHVPAGHGAATA
jgi:hypothetical protein